MYYYCEVTQPGGCGVTSNTARVDVVAAPTFIKLLDATYCVGASPTTALVMTVVGGVSPTYEWFSNSVPSISESTNLGVAVDAYLPSAAVSSDLYYYCKVSFGGGGACTELYSNFARVIVNDKPSITSQTIDICSGAPFTFTPKLTDLVYAGTTYTWSVSVSGGVTGASNPPIPVLSIRQTLTNNNSTTSTVTYLVTPTSPGVGCDGLQFTMSGRKQWLNFPGTPTTLFATVTTYIKKYKSQVGVKVMQDKAGYTSATDIDLTYAYAMWLNKDWRLYMGIAASFQSLNYDMNKLVLPTAYDPTAFTMLINESNFNSDLGVELASERW